MSTVCSLDGQAVKNCWTVVPTPKLRPGLSVPPSSQYR